MAAGQLQELVTPGGLREASPGLGRDWSPVHGHPGQLGNAGQRPSHFHLIPDEGQPHGHLMGDVPVGKVQEIRGGLCW